MSRLEKRLLKTMMRASREFQLIEPGDRVMACLSGGKDSYVMLHLLRLMQLLKLRLLAAVERCVARHELERVQLVHRHTAETLGARPRPLAEDYAAQEVSCIIGERPPRQRGRGEAGGLLVLEGMPHVLAVTV